MQQIGPIVTKVCRVCNREQPLTNFYKHKETKDRLRSECKECWNKASIKYYFDNLETVVAKRREYHYSNNYNLSLADIDDMKATQNNRCAICNKAEKLVVDHCHAKNVVRSLLCAKCNQGLGSFYDNSSILRKAADYIDEH